MVVLSVCGLCHAGEALIDRAEALKQGTAISVASYPDADSVVVNDYTVETYNPDGTGKSTNEWYEKILTEKGRRDARTASFWMNVTYGDVEVKVAEIIRPDGTSTVIDVAKTSRIMTEPGQMASNIYDPHNKILTVAFPGLEVGDIIHLVCERHNKKVPVPNAFSDYFLLEGTSPIRKMVHEIVAPAERPLVSIRVRDEIGSGVQYDVQSLENGGKRHRWSVENVAQAFPEPDMPPMHTCAQRVLVSTFGNWRELSTWYSKLSEPRMAATVPAMQQMVDELIRGAKTRDEKIWRLYTYVSQKIRYMGVTPEDDAPGYEPHDVKLTFQNKYGVCRDKAALLASMLRLANIQAYPVLIHVGERRDPDVPQLFFNHAIVAVLSEKSGATGSERYILMDPTNENSARLCPEYLCEKSFLVATPEGETLLESPALPAEENLSTIETKSEIRDGWQYAKTEIKLNGMNDTMYRSGLSRGSKEARRLFAERIIQSAVPGAVLTEMKITPDDMQNTSTPLAFEFEYAVPDSVLTGGVSVVTLPRLAGAFGYVNYLIGRTGLEKRRFPLETEIPCGVQERIEVKPGFGESRFAGAGDVSINESGISYSQTTVYTNQVLVSDSRFVMGKSLYSQAEYLGLRSALQRMEIAKRVLPMWQGAAMVPSAELASVVPLNPEKPNDLRILLDETELYPENASNAWCEVEHVRVKILSYAGKIRSGDIKLPYNPAMDSMELVSASVTGPDGSVHEVTNLEKNVMDQGWVASAPRYPGGKLLAVSFPGLEIGSIIDYTVKHRTFGAPFHAYRKQFGSFDDTDREAVTIKKGDGFRFAGFSAGPVDGVSISTNAEGSIVAACTNAPGLIPEDNMPPLRYVFKNFCSVNSGVDAWQYAGMIEAQMKAKAEGQVLAANKATELTADMGSVAEKVHAIRDFVAKNIRYDGPEYHELPLDRLSPADVTLKSGYGHQADVAILLRAMLSAVLVDSRFVFINSDLVYSPELKEDAVDSYDLFDTILVAVDDNGATYYLNEGSQYAELRATSFDGRVYADVANRKWAKLTPDVGYADSLTTHYNIDVERDGTAAVEIITEYRGTLVGDFRKLYKEITPEDRRRHVLETVSAYSRNAVLDRDYETDTDSYPGIRRFRMRIPGWAVKEGDLLNMRLLGSASTAVVPRYGERRLPFFRSGVNRLKDIWTVRFPEGMSAVKLLPEKNEFAAVGTGTELTTTCSSAIDADRHLNVKVARTAKLERALFGPDAYTRFMQAALKTQGRKADTVVISNQ